MQPAQDIELALAARDGDTSSYEQIFERYEDKIYNYAYRIAGNSEDAKDITQEAFIKVYEALPKFDKELNFAAYLYRTAHNLAIDTIRVRQKFASPGALEEQLEPNLYANPERAALLKEQQEEVRKAAFLLSEDHRAVLALRELQDLSYDEIASVLDMPKNTVGVLLSRARLKFKGAFRMSHVDVDKLSEECRKMTPMLSAFMDEELSDDERKTVEKHLDDCPLCRLALEEMTEASASYRALIPLIPAAAIRHGVFSRIAELAPLQQGPGPDTQAPHPRTDESLGDTAKIDGVPSGVGASLKKRAKRGAEKRGVREAISRFLGTVSPAQKALLAVAGVVVAAGVTLGVVLGVAALQSGRGKPSSIQTPGVVTPRALESTGAPKSGDPTVEGQRDIQEQTERTGETPDQNTGPGTSPGGTETTGTTEPGSQDPDDSKLGDQPGDRNLPDGGSEPSGSTSPDY